MSRGQNQLTIIINFFIAQPIFKCDIASVLSHLAKSILPS